MNISYHFKLSIDIDMRYEERSLWKGLIYIQVRKEHK